MKTDAEFRFAEDGQICCCTYDSNGHAIPSPDHALCDTCREWRALEGRRHSADDVTHLDAAKQQALEIRDRAAKVIDHLHAAGVQPSVEKKARFGERVPNAWDHDLAALRAATSTPESTFEEKLKADRMRAVTATRAALDAESPAPRLTTAELSAFTAPDPYRDGLSKLRERDARLAAAKEAR